MSGEVSLESDIVPPSLGSKIPLAFRLVLTSTALTLEFGSPFHEPIALIASLPPFFVWLSVSPVPIDGGGRFSSGTPTVLG